MLIKFKKYIIMFIMLIVIMNIYSNISVYPNPSDGDITIKIDSLLIDKDNIINKIIIYNIKGQQIKEILVNNDQYVVIYKKDIKSGIYFIKYKNIVKKIVILK